MSEEGSDGERASGIVWRTAQRAPPFHGRCFYTDADAAGVASKLLRRIYDVMRRRNRVPAETLALGVLSSHVRVGNSARRYIALPRFDDDPLSGASVDGRTGIAGERSVVAGGSGSFDRVSVRQSAHGRIVK